jgi:hypothetical protein
VSIRGRPAVAWVFGGGGALGGADLTVDLGLISLVGRAAALLGFIEAREAFAFAGLGRAFAFVGAALACVGLALALIGDALTIVGDALASVRRALARVGSTLALCELVLSPLELNLAVVVVVGRASVRKPEHAVQCSMLVSRARLAKSVGAQQRDAIQARVFGRARCFVSVRRSVLPRAGDEPAERAPSTGSRLRPCRVPCRRSPGWHGARRGGGLAHCGRAENTGRNVAQSGR